MHALARERPMALLVIGSLVISWAGVFVKLADVTVATSATARCLLALPVLVLLATMRTRRRAGGAPSRRTVALLGAIAGTGLAGRLLFWHASIEHVGAGLATVLQDIQVVVVPLLAWLLLDERPTPRQLASLPVVLAGCVLISGMLGTGGYGDDPLLGAALGVAAAVMYSVFQIATVHAVRRGASAIVVLAAATLVSTLLTGSWGVTGGELELPGWQSAAWLVLLALVVQVVGWVLIVGSMASLSASTVSLALLLQPIGAMVLSTALLDESPGTAQFAGVLLVCGGIAASVTRIGRRSPATTAS